MSCVKVFVLQSQLHHDLIGTHPVTGKPLVAVGSGVLLIDPAEVLHVRCSAGTLSWADYIRFATTARPIIGYVVKGPDGPSTAIHQTREIAEAEAKRLATGNTGKQFNVHPVIREAAVSRAHTPKPAVTLEKLDG